MYANHMNSFADDQLTGIAISKANDRFVTTDTIGRIKMFNISRLLAAEGQRSGKIKDRSMSEKQKMAMVSDPWFIKAHKQAITSVEIIERNMEPIEFDLSELPEDMAPEEKVAWPDLFVLTAGQDCNILLHRLSDGVRIGQFHQEEPWNIYDMTPYQTIKPNYVREWLQEKKAKWLKIMDERINVAKR